MSFLAPLFLLGTLAIAGPIIFHLIRRTTRETTSFSSLMFLRESPPRVTRRSRLENIWLLLLRCLVLALLALGFARPLWRSLAGAESKGGSGGKRIAILLDTSASMRREKLWDEARRQADELLRKAQPQDQAALLTFGDRVRTAMDFAEWKTLPPETRANTASSRLTGLAPGWSGTHLDTALTTAGELFLEPGEDRNAPGEIVVISDLQEGARLDGLQAYEWPHGVSVRIVPVKAGQLENASLQWLADAEEVGKAGEPAPLRVRVTNAAESKHEQFKVQWHDAAGPSQDSDSLDVYVPAGQTRVIKPPKLPKTSNASGASLVLSGDATEFDNRLFIIPPQPLETPLLFLGSETAEDPHGSLYYLRRAFPTTRRQNVEIITHNSGEPVPAFQLQRAQLAVLAEGASDAAVDSAREFALGGKIVVAPLASTSDAKALARLVGVQEISISEAPVKDYAMLAQIDFQDPLFASFADPRFSDFTKIHVWKYRRIDASVFAGARVPARYDTGDPAIVQVPIGKGSAVIITSTWRPADSQLALSSKFVPLLQTLLEESTNLPVQKAQYFVGDEIALAVGTQPITVQKPDGTNVNVAAGANFTETDQPGIYTVEPGGRRIAVNLAPEESRTSPLAPERLASLGVPLANALPVLPTDAPKRPTLAQATELENRQKLWRWLIVAALATLLLETLFATKMSRQPVNPQTSPL